MPIKITVRECLTAEPALQHLSNVRYAPKVAYDIARLLLLVRAEIKLYNEDRNKYISDKGVSRPVSEAEIAQGLSGEVTEILDPEERAAFLKRDNEALQTEVTLERNPILIGALSGDITGDTIYHLGPLVDDKEVEIIIPSHLRIVP